MPILSECDIYVALCDDGTWHSCPASNVNSLYTASLSALLPKGNIEMGGMSHYPYTWVPARNMCTPTPAPLGTEPLLSSTALHCTALHCTALLHSSTAALQHCTAALKHCSTAALQHCRSSAGGAGRRPEGANLVKADRFLACPVTPRGSGMQCSAVQCSAVQCSAVL